MTVQGDTPANKQRVLSLSRYNGATRQLEPVPNATALDPGMMRADDKAKLDGIAAGADVTGVIGFRREGNFVQARIGESDWVYLPNALPDDDSGSPGIMSGGQTNKLTLIADEATNGADWNAAAGARGHIANKPTIPTGAVVPAGNMVWRGVWSESVVYAPGDVVVEGTLAGRRYVCVQATTVGVLLSQSAYWRDLAPGADWDEASADSPRYIANKPTLHRPVTAGVLNIPGIQTSPTWREYPGLIGELEVGTIWALTYAINQNPQPQIVQWQVWPGLDHIAAHPAGSAVVQDERTVSWQVYASPAGSTVQQMAIGHTDAGELVIADPIAGAIGFAGRQMVLVYLP